MSLFLSRECLSVSTKAKCMIRKSHMKSFILPQGSEITGSQWYKVKMIILKIKQS